MDLKARFRGFIGVAALAMFVASPAQSAYVSYFLDKSNDLTDGVNYAKVTISDGAADSSDGMIDFQIDVLSDSFPDTLGSNFGMETFSFNYDTSLTVDAANITNIDPSTWTISQDKNAGGGFGKFEFQLSGTGASRVLQLSFSIRDVAGDSLSSYAIGSTLNPSSGEFFAAHIADYGCDVNRANCSSGKFAGSTVVPVPAAVWLFGSGLLGLVGVARRRRG